MLTTSHKLIRTLLITALISFCLQAAPLGFDDPQFVRLSDGRLVPGPAGTICTAACAPAPEEEKPGRKRILIPLAIASTAAIACLLGCDGATGHVPVPSSEQPEPVPELPTGATLALALLAAAAARPFLASLSGCLRMRW